MEFLKCVVAVFAHNEEKSIVNCLEALKKNECYRFLKIIVIENGSSDKTAELVNSYCTLNPQVSLFQIIFGDKLNAWNEFVHNYTEDSSIAFFTDGDVTIVPNSLDAILKTFEQNKTALAVASFQENGRSSDWSNQYIKSSHNFFGNLYAVRQGFLDELKRKKIRLPIGYIGDDSILNYLIKTSLIPNNEPNKENIAVCEAAFFRINSLSRLKISDWKLFYKKQRSYALRRIHDHLLIPYIKKHGVESMPKHIHEIYSLLQKGTPSIRYFSYLFFFDLVARNKVVKIAKQYK